MSIGLDANGTILRKATNKASDVEKNTSLFTASHMTTFALFECLYALDAHMTTTVSPNMVRIFPPIYTEEDMPFLDVRA